jgi:hypothetical protein
MANEAEYKQMGATADRLNAYAQKQNLNVSFYRTTPGRQTYGIGFTSSDTNLSKYLKEQTALQAGPRTPLSQANYSGQAGQYFDALASSSPSTDRRSDSHGSGSVG